MVARMFHEGASSEREGGSGAGARGRGRSSRDRARSGGGVRDRRKVQPVWKSTGVSGAPTILHEVISRRWRGRAGSVERWGTDTATPSSRRRVDGVEVVKF